MLLVDEYKLATSEDLLKLLDRVKNLNLKVWEVASQRYQFNLRVDRFKVKDKVEKNLLTFKGKRVFIANANSTKSFCFRPRFLIKREMYNLAKQRAWDIVKPQKRRLDLNLMRSFSPIIYNRKTIYGNIDLYHKTEILRFHAEVDNKITEIPPIGIAMDGIPFFEDKIVDEAQTSGWWIEGSSIKFFINTFGEETLKNITLKIFYHKG